MAEYIKREKIYADISRLLIDKDSADLTDCEDGWTSAISEAMDVIKNAPAADVRPEMHGKWMRSGDGYSYFCSICGEEPYSRNEVFPILSDFCPWCGAKMDGKKV